jgi:serine protease
VRFQISFLFLLIGSTVLAQNFAAKTIVFKLKAGTEKEVVNGQFRSADLKAFALRVGVLEIEQVFPNVREGARSANGLKRIHQFSFASNYPEGKIIAYLNQKGIFEWVERRSVPRISFTPNDPFFNQQNYLDSISAPAAWDLSRASGNRIIAIIDTGVEDDHPDLMTKIYVNSGDPINGNDDDGDGYIDNNLGWNFVQQNGDVSYTDSDHGVHVAGIAGAATNNLEGVAGVGFDARLMILKAGERLDITNGYEAIVYAADQGAEVINCSWGEYYPSHLGKAAVDYALDKGCVIVGAAGNDGDPDPFYPAAYDGVLSVAAVNNDGSKAGIANFGHHVDLGAPGIQIRSTVGGKGYNTNSGSSMSSPMVAGALALLKELKPSLSGEEMAAVIRNTTDDRYDLLVNAPWYGLIGTGRLNVERALLWADSANLVMTDYTASDGNDDWFGPGDTLNIIVDVKSMVAQSDNVIVQLKFSDSNVASSPVTTASLGNVGRGATGSNTTAFQLILGTGIPINHQLDLEVEMINQLDTFRDWFSIDLNTSYLNVEENKLKMTYTSQGLIGYNRYPELDGDGFVFESGPSLMYEGGFAMGFIRNSENIVLDRLRGFNDVGETDWSIVEAVRRNLTVDPCEEFAYGSFQDNINYDLKVDQRVWACSSPAMEQSIFLEYLVKNESAETYSNFYGGFFADFDIGDFEKNKGNFDGQRFLTYTYSEEAEDTGIYLGLQLIEPEIYKTYLISHESGGEGGVDLVDTDVFISDEKFTVLQGGKLNAGLDDGTDVFSEVSSGPYSLAAGDSMRFVYALLVGESLEDLQERADSTYFHYHKRLPASSPNRDRDGDPMLFPNPFSDHLNFNFASSGKYSITIFDVLGKVILAQEGHSSNSEQHLIRLELPAMEAGLYTVELKTSSFSKRWKMLHSQAN